MFTRPNSFRISSLAAALAAGFAFTFIAPVAAPASLGAVTAAHAQEPSQFRSILANYGSFQAHAKYGEVWVPARSTAPEGWHPYPPCNWVHTKDLGWYFNDKTEWGRIVHHYGRWAHDKDLGWVWVRGEEFSPGWVVWRTSESYVGWAPMPPEQDIKEISATEFNNDKHWIFVEAKKFSNTCSGGATIVSNPPATIFTETRLVTEIRFVKGIAIFVLPPPLIINIVDIDINVFPAWNPCFFGAWFWNWNMLINNVVININLPQQCPIAQPVQKQIIPIKSSPPPAPGQSPKPEKHTELPPSVRPPVLIDPPRLVTPSNPVEPKRPVVVLPDPPRIPPIVKDPRPHRPIPPLVKLPEPKKPTIIIDPKRPVHEGNGRGEQGKGKGGSDIVVRRPVPKLVREGNSIRVSPNLSKARVTDVKPNAPVKQVNRGQVLR